MLTGASWVEINADALLENLKQIRSLLFQRGQKKVRVGVVVKGNAYGHGLRTVVEVLAKATDWQPLYYVISYAEALAVQETAGKEARVVILGALPCLRDVDLGRRFEWALSSESQLSDWLEALRGLSSVQRQELLRDPLQFHVHVDSGLGREGFLPEQMEDVFHRLSEEPVCRLRGLMTHFANTEDVTRQDYALKQEATFGRVVNQVNMLCKNAGISCPERHLAATAATLNLPSSAADVVRIGIGLYGLWPSNEARLSFQMSAGDQAISFRPVLSWRVQSQCIKVLPEGSYVGYGCTHRCERETRIAVFPVGYADGYVRLLGEKAHVLVQGKWCRVLGRVMMNHIVVDISPCSVKGDEAVVATLLGRDGEFEVRAEDLAEWSGTINYEAVTRIAAHLLRVMTFDEKTLHT